MSTFTWIPDAGATCTREPRVRKAQFGDGYEQRAADGINNDLRSWSVSFSVRTNAEIALIDAFLTTCGGVTAFTWADPDGNSSTYVCRKWTRTVGQANIQAISATFDEVPL